MVPLTTSLFETCVQKRKGSHYCTIQIKLTLGNFSYNCTILNVMKISLYILHQIGQIQKRRQALRMDTNAHNKHSLFSITWTVHCCLKTCNHVMSYTTSTWWKSHFCSQHSLLTVLHKQLSHHVSTFYISLSSGVYKYKY